VPGASVRLGRAFAPSHVSGVFAPQLEARDPRGRGSLGAGLVLSVGVTASAVWRSGPGPSVRLTADRPSPLEISHEVARRLVADRPGDLSVHLEHALPIGQGFGSSAAGALATGLAVAAALGLPRRRAVEVAHLADLFGGGGLGGVAAILGGGLEMRLKAGIPPYGRVVRRQVERTVLVGTVGAPIRSPTVLRDPRHLDRFANGERLVRELARHPSWSRFWSVSERFTDSAGIASPRLSNVLRGLRARGARAAQAMFGRSFFATVPDAARAADARRWLDREGVAFRELRVGRRGARVLPWSGAPSARTVGAFSGGSRARP
jgi:pantoate kinase